MPSRKRSRSLRKRTLKLHSDSSSSKSSPILAIHSPPRNAPSSSSSSILEFHPPSRPLSESIKKEIEDSMTDVSDTTRNDSDGTEEELPSSRALNEFAKLEFPKYRDAFHVPQSMFILKYLESLKYGDILSKLQSVATDIIDDPADKFPASVMLITACHGQVLPPFLSPLHVTRFMASDFGTCNFMEDAFLEQIPKRVQDLHGDTLRSWLSDTRSPTTPEWAKKYSPKSKNRYNLYKKSKHHLKSKVFTKNTPIFNKKLGPDKEQLHTTHSNIFIRDVSGKHFFKELELGRHKTSILLSEVLQYLVCKGVQTVEWYDLTCSEYNGPSEHYKLFGGR